MHAGIVLAWSAALAARPEWFYEAAVDSAANLRSALLERSESNLGSNLTLRDTGKQGAKYGCGDPQPGTAWCSKLREAGMDQTIAGTCIADESGEWFCGGRGTCVGKMSSEDTDCDESRLVCMEKTGDVNHLMKVQAEAMTAAVAIKATGMHPECPTPHKLKLAPIGIPEPVTERNADDTYLECTEFNPSEESRAYSTIKNGLHTVLSKLDSGGGWVPNSNSNDEYLEIDIGRVVSVQGVVTQGVARSGKYVKSYTLSSSQDGENWREDKTTVFAANSDDSTRSANSFSTPFPARYVRIVPQSWEKGVAMRAGLLLCGESSTCTEREVLNPTITRRNMSSGWKRVERAEDVLGGDPRLDGAGWCAGNAMVGQFTQMDLDTVEKVTGIRVQGVSSPSFNSVNIVTDFRIAFSMDGSDWTMLKGNFETGLSMQKVEGNPGYHKDRIFPYYFAARYIRIYPTAPLNGHMCMRTGAIVCKDSGDGCTGKYWCENLLSAGMELAEAKGCYVNGDAWYCSNGRPGGFQSTCVGHGKEDDFCNNQAQVCVGPHDDTFGSPIVQAQQVVGAVGAGGYHMRCPTRLRWNVHTKFTCGIGGRCPIGEHQRTLTIESRNDVTRCRDYCAMRNGESPFADEPECVGFVVNAQEKKCTFLTSIDCGQEADPNADCWSVREGTPIGGDIGASAAKMAHKQRTQGKKAVDTRQQGPTPSPTPKPTPSPTVAQTDQPTPEPTPYPTDTPTPMPTPAKFDAGADIGEGEGIPPVPAPTFASSTTQAEQEFLLSVLGDNPLLALTDYVQNVKQNELLQRALNFAEAQQANENLQSEIQFNKKQLKHLQAHLKKEEGARNVDERNAAKEEKAWLSAKIQGFKARLYDYKNQSKMLKDELRDVKVNTSTVSKAYQRQTKTGMKEAQKEYKSWIKETEAEWESYLKEKKANFTAAQEILRQGRLDNHTKMLAELQNISINAGIVAVQIPSDQEAYKREYPLESEWLNDQQFSPIAAQQKIAMKMNPNKGRGAQ